jgi:hypothetical protein
MKQISRKIETLSNVAIIVVAIVLTFTLIKGYSSKNPAAAPVPSPAVSNPTINSANLVGKKLNVPDVDWAKNGKTLVMAVQSGCHFCTESGPFYQELAKRQSVNSKVKLVAVLPQTVDDGRQYLDSLGVPIAQVRQMSLGSLGVSGTPTLMLADNSGIVIDAWVGKLDDSKQAVVLDKMR